MMGKYSGIQFANVADTVWALALTITETFKDGRKHFGVSSAEEVFRKYSPEELTQLPKSSSKTCSAVPGELYRHYKGHEYAVTDIAINTETEEEMVVYRDIVSGKTWVRPASMWDDIVAEGKIRFEKI
jgi:disulfide oxidoreductase YuzD